MVSSLVLKGNIGLYTTLMVLGSSSNIGLMDSNIEKWGNNTVESSLVKLYKDSHEGLNINYTSGMDIEIAEKLRDTVDKEAREKLDTHKRDAEFMGGEYVTRIKADNAEIGKEVVKVGEILLRNIYIGKYIDINKENKILIGEYDSSNGYYEVYSRDEFRCNNNVVFSSSMRGTTKDSEWISERDYIDGISDEVLSIFKGKKDGVYIENDIRDRLANKIANENVDRVSIEYIDFGKSSLDNEDIDRLYIQLEYEGLDTSIYKDLELWVDRNGKVIEFDIISEGHRDK